MTPEQNLIVAAARLSGAAPQSWDDFLKAFNLFSWDLANVVVMSPPDTLSVNQGRAQGAAMIGRILANCREKMEAMDKNQSIAKE